MICSNCGVISPGFIWKFLFHALNSDRFIASFHIKVFEQVCHRFGIARMHCKVHCLYSGNLKLIRRLKAC